MADIKFTDVKIKKFTNSYAMIIPANVVERNKIGELIKKKKDNCIFLEEVEITLDKKDKEIWEALE